MNLLFYCSVFCLVLVFALYFWFVVKSSAAREDIQSLKDAGAALLTKESRKAEKELVAVSKRIDDFAKIFEEHKLTSVFFQFLEESVHPKVQLLTLSLNPESLKVSFTAKAATIRAVGEQLLWLQQSELVEEIILTGPSLDDEGAVSFGLALILKPEVFSNFSE